VVFRIGEKTGVAAEAHGREDIILARRLLIVAAVKMMCVGRLFRAGK